MRLTVHVMYTAHACKQSRKFRKEGHSGVLDATTCTVHVHVENFPADERSHNAKKCTYRNKTTRTSTKISWFDYFK